MKLSLLHAPTPELLLLVQTAAVKSREDPSDLQYISVQCTPPGLFIETDSDLA